MAKKIRITKKDSMLVIVGILLSFSIQSGYDAIREWMDMGNYSQYSQFMILLLLGILFALLASLVLRNTVEK